MNAVVNAILHAPTHGGNTLQFQERPMTTLSGRWSMTIDDVHHALKAALSGAPCSVDGSISVGKHICRVSSGSHCTGHCPRDEGTEREGPLTSVGSFERALFACNSAEDCKVGHESGQRMTSGLLASRGAGARWLVDGAGKGAPRLWRRAADASCPAGLTIWNDHVSN